ncbi:MAG: hypothetical protein K6E33_00085 [Lachnospiraceae bacterium]|nr:hypothetical protein [Lachnospiraceae bacterium]
MKITPIDSYNFINSRYGVRDIPYVGKTAQGGQEETGSKQEVTSAQAAPKETVEVKNQAPKATDPNSVSLTFNKNDDFSYIGSESPLQNLDMQKAISNMNRDSILADYRRFVGTPVASAQPENGGVFVDDADGTVLLK